MKVEAGKLYHQTRTCKVYFCNGDRRLVALGRFDGASGGYKTQYNESISTTDKMQRALKRDETPSNLIEIGDLRDLATFIKEEYHE